VDSRRPWIGISLGVVAMKTIICQRDGNKCDLDTKAKKCRHMNNWNGKCFSRLESNIISIHKIHDAEKDDELEGD
jgi:hypothetical protein